MGGNEMDEKRIIEIFLENFEKYTKPAFVKYSKEKEESMSAPNPSYVLDKLTGGVCKPK